ncbi:MAG TPA: CoA ester lyase [Geminicoccaceae bacterium]|nr:CoA ester lyase [Geminicoccaceae bacterium]
MTETIQPRRNLLFVPGTRPDRFPKALAAGPDMVTVDLEDAVIPPLKDEARAQTMTLFDGPRADGIERVVRISGVRTPFGLKDLLAIVEHPSPPDAIMLPKVESADEVRIVDALLQRAARPVGLHVIIESNAGLEQASAIGGACPSIRSLLFGAVDMAAELGAAMDFTSMLYARSRVVHAAASHGLDAIDVPYLDLEDAAGLAEECRLVRDLGFTGKAAIHPRQLATINATFTPDAERIAYAKKVIAAFETSPDGLVVVDGKLIEIPVIRSARRTLAIAAATGAL